MTVSKYFAAKKSYFAGDPIMTDTEFDAFELALSKTNPEILKHIGSNERTGKEKLPMVMGSLNQIRNEKEWSAWKNNFPKAREYLFTEKIDGNSCLLEYKNGVLINSWSRGDGVYGASNIRHTSKMVGLPAHTGDKFTGFIRGELVIAKKDWPALLAEADREYANARNFVAGFLNSTKGQGELYKYFKFVAFEMFANYKNLMDKSAQMRILSQHYNFTTPVTYLQNCHFTYKDVEMVIAQMIEHSEYELDGVVVDVDSIEYRKFNATSDDLNPNYSVKIKLVNSSVETEVIGIEWSVSKDSFYKPVILIEPVYIGGVTISRCSGFNARFIYDNKIQPGSIVKIHRAGDVIPTIIGFGKPGPLQ